MDIMGTTALSNVLILTMDCFVGTSVIVTNQDVTQYLVVGFMVKLPLLLFSLTACMKHSDIQYDRSKKMYFFF